METAKEEVKRHLAELDDFGDGTVDAKIILAVLRMGNPKVTKRDVDRLLRHLEPTSEGRVHSHSFVDYIFGGHGRTARPPTADSVSTCASASRLPPRVPPTPAVAHHFDKQWAVPRRLDRSVLREFMELSQHGRVQAEYVWLDSEYSDGKSFDLCSKSLTLDFEPTGVEQLPFWTYSGTDDRDVHIAPRAFYRDPFRQGNNILVLADTYDEPKSGSGLPIGDPKPFNSRAPCAALMDQVALTGEDPWFGIEQEYYLLDVHTGWPLGWPVGDFPGHHSDYYCATGAGKAVGRDIVEAHYRACLYAGVKIGGVNSEVAPGQWEFQVGPCSGTKAGDDLWMARYLLQRICELFQVDVTFDPKPVPNWAGLGAHTNYSTVATRQAEGGMGAIWQQIEKLRARHNEHIEHYGIGNERRMTGEENAPMINEFSAAVGDRDVSIRIPSGVAAKGFGYYEDRRPAANMDPYLVTRLIVETTLCGDQTKAKTSEETFDRQPSRESLESGDGVVNERRPSALGVRATLRRPSKQDSK
eukprot:TRINITY_DN65387_c0_g1_i1.p1 TRINITY_DN65387_c0_g1~~TRINITY_DN65387_c0_g1_i1.p1  ORF type:complete len:527 (+),score=94.20 TRINITY_DN65387_c0_g1_i1:68-1648(+)